MAGKIKNNFSHTRFIVLGFIIIILVGALFLMTPWASKDKSVTDFWDCLFTSASAACVTGLTVVDTYSHWSLFGQLVILCLIQIGGLGFITIGVFFSVIFRRRIGLQARGLMQESVNALHMDGIIKLTKKIIRGTLFFEGIGALILGIRFSMDLGFVKGMYYGVFHSISAFCNAGIDLMGIFEPGSSFSYYAFDPVVMIVVMLLVIIGGIGFLVWDDISINKFNVRKYSLHTKIVLITSLCLTVIGATLYYAVEYNASMADLNIYEKIAASIFYSVNTRSSGFCISDITTFSDSGKLLTMVLMFIGASPGSTAGGIKTTTFFVLLASMWVNMTNMDGISVFKRRLEEDAIRKAAIVVALNMTLAICASFIILAVNGLPFIDVLFEVFAAIGTTGMSLGVTQSLNIGCRFVIIVLMFCGRLGSLTFALSFMKYTAKKPVYAPQEKISIG